jgi:hypothetical protein
LFAVLLGADWQKLLDKAGGGALELELDMAGAGGLFERLPWEMMFTTDGPLAGLKISGRRVALSRIVRAVPTPKPSPIEIPLRVLFVVGCQMDDVIRPGAEYLALLRQFEVQLDAPGRNFGVALHSKLLLSATREDVIRAVKSFQPAVVHLISHGRWDGAQTVILLTKIENSLSVEDPVTPQDLLPLLSSGVQAVVLNACHTATTSPDDVHMSYAAQLVAGGIPVAVGMAGQVADSVCRLFTASFYSALYERGSLPLAVCEGRRAALLQYKTHTHNVEWARPVLYLADETPTTFEVNLTKQKIAIAAKALRKRKEILCDRMNYLQDLEGVCDRRITNLGLAVQELRAGLPAIQLGKTWLLEEMQWLALLEGYAPCLLESHAEVDPPANFLAFALALAEAMNKARKAWGESPVWHSAAIAAIYTELGRTIPADENQLVVEYGKVLLEFQARNAYSMTPDAVQWQILRDLTTLLSEAKRELGARGILILIDDLHRYEGSWKSILASAGGYGLGDQNTPAPLVFTYSTHEKAGPEIVQFLADNSSKFEWRPLTRFGQEERRSVYRQSLLSRKLVATAKPALQKMVETMYGRFEKLTQGIPSYLRLPKLEDQLEVDIDNEVLITSDDAAIIRSARSFDGI